MIINNCNLPKPLYDAWLANEYNPGETDFSASNIVLGAKEYWSKKRSTGSINTNADKSWSSFIGTLIHLGLEYLLNEHNRLTEDEGVLYELEIHKEIPFKGMIIGGTIDGVMIYPDGTMVMFDWKTMNSVQFIDEKKMKDYTLKANFYNYVFAKSGYDFKRIKYLPIFRDWNYAKASRSKRTDDFPTLTVDVPIKPLAETEKWISDRIDYFEQYRNTPLEEIPYCTPEERWESKLEFKVGYVDADGKVDRMHNGCSFNTKEEAAVEMMKRNGGTISKTGKHIPPKKLSGIKKVGGVATKCNIYCDIGNAGLCDFKLKHKEK